MTDGRIQELVKAIDDLKEGQYRIEIRETNDDFGILANSLRELARKLERRAAENRVINSVVTEINTGLFVNDVLEHIFDSFRPIIPYDRIGCAMVDDDVHSVGAIWARADYAPLLIEKGYKAPLEGSSLRNILDTGVPRIINDTETYLSEHPHSAATRLIVKEGIRSSLTCPLVATNKPIGFLFFPAANPIPTGMRKGNCSCESPGNSRRSSRKAGSTRGCTISTAPWRRPRNNSSMMRVTIT